MVSRNLERVNENDGFKMTALELILSCVFNPFQAAAYEKEKQALNREVLTLSQKLLDTKFEINKMEEKNVSLYKSCRLRLAVPLYGRLLRKWRTESRD